MQLYSLFVYYPATVVNWLGYIDTNTPYMLYFSFKILQIPRARDHKFEASVQTDCTITNITVYNWILEYRGIPHRLNLLDEGLEPSNDRILPMPRKTLGYGNYSLTVEVCLTVPSITFSRARFSLLSKEVK